MAEQIEKAIVRKDKTGEIQIFWLDTRANFGNIGCNGVMNEHSLWCFGEASDEYYHETKKASPEEVEIAKKAALSAYGIQLDVRQRMTYADRMRIWGYAS